MDANYSANIVASQGLKTSSFCNFRMSKIIFNNIYFIVWHTNWQITKNIQYTPLIKNTLMFHLFIGKSSWLHFIYLKNAIY